MRIEHELDQAASQILQTLFGVKAAALLKAVQDPKHGDFQINGLLPLAKTLGKPPRELGAQVLPELLKLEAVASAEIAGPGFINVRLKEAWLSRELLLCYADRERDGMELVEPAQRIVVDFSSPNVAKQMHVGHLRSTILGESLARTFRFLGHTVIADNHLGDWGTQFGLLIAQYKAAPVDLEASAKPLQALEELYRQASLRAKADTAFAEAARSELAKLQKGDADNYSLWKRFVDVTLQELSVIYARLDVHFDSWCAESFYNDRLPGVVELLLQKELARLDDGALCVFFEDVPELAQVETPLIVQKKDGSYLYSTTDIATLFYRHEELKAQKVLYVVDNRQSLHFKQLFALAAKLENPMQLEHVRFGSVLGKDGKPLKTREGQAISLRNLLDEAEERALARIREEGLEIPEDELQAVAQAVGIGAVKYADLKQNRLTDYVFDWEKMISFRGNSGPYLQYAYARVQSIFRKGQIDANGILEGSLILKEPSERALGLHLLRFADVVVAAAEHACPHYICDHLYQLAKLLSTFYEACPVLKAEEPLRTHRLILLSLTARQLRRGLALLGIQVVERM